MLSVWTIQFGPNSKHLQTTNKILLQLQYLIFDIVENKVGKGENAGYHHFLLLSLFPKGFFFKVVKSCDCEVKT